MSLILDVLCPGPSLKRYDPSRNPDITICLNRAIHQFPCDWWCLQDKVVWDNTEKRPSKGLITTEFFLSKIEDKSSFEIITLHGKKVNGGASNWTSPRMMSTILAKFANYEIHVFGMDMAGVDYYDGTEWLPRRKTKRDVLAKRAEEIRWPNEKTLIMPFFNQKSVFRH